MGLLSFLSGSGAASEAVKAGAKIASGGMDMLDNSFYTDQERAEMACKLTENYLKHMEAVQEETSPRSLSRRYTAFSVLVNVFIAMWTCIGLSIWANPMTLKGVLDILGYFHLGWAFTCVIVFYFGSHMVGYLKKA